MGPAAPALLLRRAEKARHRSRNSSITSGSVTRALTARRAQDTCTISMTSPSKLPEILRRNEGEILTDWMRHQLSSTRRARQSDPRERTARAVPRVPGERCAKRWTTGNRRDIDGPAGARPRIRRRRWRGRRARQGFTPVETATFIFSLKLPMFARLRQEYGNDAASLGGGDLDRDRTDGQAGAVRHGQCIRRRARK